MYYIKKSVVKFIVYIAVSLMCSCRFRVLTPGLTSVVLLRTSQSTGLIEVAERIELMHRLKKKKINQE